MKIGLDGKVSYNRSMISRRISSTMAGIAAVIGAAASSPAGAQDLPTFNIKMQCFTAAYSAGLSAGSGFAEICRQQEVAAADELGNIWGMLPDDVKDGCLLQQNLLRIQSYIILQACVSRRINGE